jgi:hypothetical protein
VHDEAHVRVDLRDAGIVTECGEMSIGWSTWVTILVGSGMLTGTTMLSPNGKPTAIGNMLDRNSLCSSLVGRSARRAAPRSADIVGISLSDDMTPTIFG